MQRECGACSCSRAAQLHLTARISAVTITNTVTAPGEAGQTASELVEAPRAVRGEAGGLQLPGPGGLLLGLAEEEAVYPGRGVAAHLHM